MCLSTPLTRRSIEWKAWEANCCAQRQPYRKRCGTRLSKIPRATSSPSISTTRWQCHCQSPRFEAFPKKKLHKNRYTGKSTLASKNDTKFKLAGSVHIHAQEGR